MNYPDDFNAILAAAVAGLCANSAVITALPLGGSVAAAINTAAVAIATAAVASRE